MTTDPQTKDRACPLRTRRPRGRLRALVLTILMLIVPCILSGRMAVAQEVARIVYVGLKNDPYYEPRPGYTGLSLRDIHRPLEGAGLAIRSARVLSRSLGITFQLDEMLLDDPDGSAAAAQTVTDAPLGVLLDLPSDAMSAFVENWTGAGALFDIRHRERTWRDGSCDLRVIHTLPSDDMLSDALAQQLHAQGWDQVLLLEGSNPRDEARAASARRSIAKYGLTLAGDRVFRLSNDPRDREANNVRLLTGGVRHDVIWLIDSEGEFGRYVPYATYDARPVVGDEGLTPHAWHWTYERHGAPQLNQRFLRQTGRVMISEDWAAWVAARALIEAVQRVNSADPATVADFVWSDALSLDLYKGVSGSVRPWSGQLRQPVLLATHNAVVAVAPLDGFEHRLDTLDTLGIDAPESPCPN